MKKKALETHVSDPRWELIQRLIASAQLRGSPRLRELLLYVADCALRNSPEEVTEQQIGIQIFGRAPGFNSSEDSIVRTQVRLLRQKMGAYFATEGAAEGMIVDIPKGHYLPVFHKHPIEAPETSGYGEAERLADHLKAVIMPQSHAVAEVIDSPWSLAVAHSEADSQTTPARPPEQQPRKPLPSLLLLLAATITLFTLIAGALGLRSRGSIHPSPVLTLWRPFLTEEPPLVIYSNALFEGDSKTGLRYAGADTPHNQPMAPHLVDHYTGVGELVSVYQITRLFDSQKATFTLKRSLLVTWDEAKLRNLIFVGAAAENGSMRVLPPVENFTMTSGDGFSSIVNQHPLHGEPALLSRPEYPLTRDYAIIALVPGMEPGRHTLVLSGLTTMGTEAAVEFACRPETAAELLKAVGYTSGEVRPFEAVLEVSIGGGVPLQSRIVLIRVH